MSRSRVARAGGDSRSETSAAKRPRFAAVRERELYVALHDGTIKHSTDDGMSREVRSKP